MLHDFLLFAFLFSKTLYLQKYNSESITEEEIAQMIDNLNNRPRKIVGYLTPNEVYLQKLKQ